MGFNYKQHDGAYDYFSLKNNEIKQNLSKNKKTTKYHKETWDKKFYPNIESALGDVDKKICGLSRRHKKKDTNYFAISKTPKTREKVLEEINASLTIDLNEMKNEENIKENKKILKEKLQELDEASSALKNNEKEIEKYKSETVKAEDLIKTVNAFLTNLEEGNPTMKDIEKQVKEIKKKAKNIKIPKNEKLLPSKAK